MFNKKFVSIGVGKILDWDYKTDNICSDLNYKPTKGLWSSEYIENGDYLSDWEEFYYGGEDVVISDYSIFKLKDSARIIILDRKEDVYKYPGYVLEKELDELILKECSESLFWLDDEKLIELCKKHKFYKVRTKATEEFSIFNMEKILEDYDGIYVSERFIEETSEDNFHWRCWDVNTLVVFNIDCINIIKEVSSSTEK